MFWHTGFHVLAWLAGMALILMTYRWSLSLQVDSVIKHISPLYFVAFTSGGLIGAYALGTLNLSLSGIPGFGRSFLGALVGGIIFVEIYKYKLNIYGSTGIGFAPGLALTITIGRIGCFCAGLDDFTYGIPTDYPWAIDLGDGIARHPVPLYESFSMFIWLLIILFAFFRQNLFVKKNCFYLLVGWYGVQRFIWEFFKPYATLIGPFNLFHLFCVFLICYSVFMIKRQSI